MILLINKQTVAARLQVAIGYDAQEFNVFISEAQEFDLKPLVPENFYSDLLSKRAEEPWKKLIDGGDYTHDGRDYNFAGIGAVLSYFSYGRFAMGANQVSSSHGFVQKTNPNSQPLSLEEKKNIYYRKKGEAKALFDDVVKFIERNINTYSSWNPDSGCSNYSGPTSTRVIQ